MNKRISSINCVPRSGADLNAPTAGVRSRRAGYITIGLTLVGLGLAGCSATGPEPVALDQNPGDNGAPTAILDFSAVRDATLRTVLVSNQIQGSAPATVAGYRVAAARDDVVAGHRARIVTYDGAKGIVTLCSWAANGESPHGVETATYRGTKIVYWNDGRTEYWVAAAASTGGLDAFAESIRKNTI